MKHLLTILLSLISIYIFAQEKMYIHKSDKITLGVPISSIDSIYFSPDESLTYFRINGIQYEFPTLTIDSITFGNNSNTIHIKYEENSVRIINPLAFEGVSITVDHADVTINSTTEEQDINYELSGTTLNGMFKIYSAKRFNAELHGVNITNPDGPAINIQSEKKASIELVSNSTNTLTDGSTYAPAPINGNGEVEDQDAAFFSEAKLVFVGSGSLTINGNGTNKHALCSDDLIQITDGTIIVNKAVKDGIHANDGIEISGGTINVSATGDAIDAGVAYVYVTGGNITTVNSQADVKGISCDSTIYISGGTLNLTVTGNQSKAMKCDQVMTLSGGQITIHNSGDAVLNASGSGFDPSYCTALKSDAKIIVNGATLFIVSSGKAAKSISSDGNIEISSGFITITNSGTGTKYTNSAGQADAYVAVCLSADLDIEILGGTISTSSSGSAGKGISADGKLTIGNVNSSPIITITTTGSKVLVSGSGNNAVYAEAKAVSCDSNVKIDNGTITISTTDDGIKSKTAIDVNNGSLNITNSVEGLEAPFITFNNGNINVKASDDCINATFGNGGEINDGSHLKINGGTLVVNTSGGDGLDSNGNITIMGGTTIVHGPPSAPEVGIDYNGICNVNGGFLVVSGTNSFMTQAPSNSSTQYSVLAKSNSSLSASTLFHMQNASGNDVVTFQPIRSYYSIIVSSSMLANGGTYSIYTGGVSTGNNNNGLYTGGTYSGGSLKKTFTINSIVTTVSF